MSLPTLVVGKQTGTFGPFEVTDGNVTKNRRVLLQFFNVGTALVPMDARSSFTTADEHAAFDSTLMALSNTGTAIRYIDSIGTFMNPKSRFAEWLKGELTPDSVGIKLTAEELAVPTAYESAKAKFVALFTPAAPALSSGGIDLIAAGFSVDQALKIDEWRNNTGSGLPGAVINLVNADQKKRNFLRIVKGGGNSYKVENAGGHTITRTQFLRSYNDTIKALWDRTAPNGEVGRLGQVYVETKERGSQYAREKTVEVFNNYVTIGCQSIPRAEVERVVAEFAANGLTK